VELYLLSPVPVFPVLVVVYGPPLPSACDSLRCMELPPTEHSCNSSFPSGSIDICDVLDVCSNRNGTRRRGSSQQRIFKTDYSSVLKSRVLLSGFKPLEHKTGHLPHHVLYISSLCQEIFNVRPAAEDLPAQVWLVVAPPQSWNSVTASFSSPHSVYRWPYVAGGDSPRVTFCRRDAKKGGGGGEG
jgi:hypothetical protein